jgi:TonB family protein
VPMPEPVMEQPTPETVEESSAITDETSEEAPTLSDKKQDRNQKNDTQVRKDNPQQQQTPQQQVSNNLNNAFNNIKGGSGTTTGTGQQGDPNGSISGRGVLGGGGSSGTGGGSGGGNGTGTGTGTGGGSGSNWSLAGRQILNNPKVQGNAPDEGTVTVDIWVDANGNVTKAIANAAKSNTTSGTLFKMAEDAARKAKFNSSASGNEQKGSIKITFKLH